MAFQAPLTYKGRPLVRSKNQLYYGNMTDPYIVYLQILTTKPEGDLEVADRVHMILMSTDNKKSLQDRMLKQSDKNGLYNALDFACIWLEHASAETEKK